MPQSRPSRSPPLPQPLVPRPTRRPRRASSRRSHRPNERSTCAGPRCGAHRDQVDGPARRSAREGSVQVRRAARLRLRPGSAQRGHAEVPLRAQPRRHREGEIRTQERRGLRGGRVHPPVLGPRVRVRPRLPGAGHVPQLSDRALVLEHGEARRSEDVRDREHRKEAGGRDDRDQGGRGLALGGAGHGGRAGGRRAARAS